MSDLYIKDKPKLQSWIFLREHIYYDEQGSIIAKKIIYDTGEGNKTAEWYRYENFAFIKKLNGLQMPLYNLPLITSTTNTIYIAEGEKDCNTLFDELGYTATTLPNGAGGKWREKYNKHLAERDIIILTDNDDAGKKYGETVVNALLPVAKSVKLIPAAAIYPEIKHKGDISDIVSALGVDAAKEMLDKAVAVAETITEPFNIEPIPIEHIGEKNLKPPDYSDAGNAEIFSRFYKDDLIFVDALGWLWWNGKRWERDDHKALALVLSL
ncbi:MAG: hypothetical protein KBI01_06905, partial [Oscillospiraceae bacterium]|nr:hypothetical protein [Oscillospiraceae bacterium]